MKESTYHDILEACLQGLENGADLDAVLRPYPELAAELRPVLKASIQARNRAQALLRDPSPEAFRRGRANLLQHAATLRELQTAPRKSIRIIPLFQRLAISFALTATFLVSGTGLVGASSSALPGENLYPVKRNWESLRLFFAFDEKERSVLENEFESERLQEVGALLVEGRHETIEFAGVFTQANGTAQVSGVTVLFPSNQQIPADGSTVIIAGRTNAQGFVEIESMNMLPDGAIVPAGAPVEMEADGFSGGSQIYEMNGILESFSTNETVINGQTYSLDNVAVDGALSSGAKVEVKGYFAADGNFVVTEIKVKHSKSEDNGDNGGGDNGDNGGDSGNNDGNDNSGDNDGGGNGSGDNNNDSNGDSGNNGGRDGNSDNNDRHGDGNNNDGEDNKED